MEPLEVVTAFAHPTRRRIAEYLHLHGDSQVGTLATALREQVGSISHHLRVLEKVGLVERAPELATDGRTSWWRATRISMSWSADDFDGTAERVQARMAERANVRAHLERVAEWDRRSDRADEAWRRSAFRVDQLALATPEELGRLSDLLVATLAQWRDSVDTDDGQEREPVFVLAHGFPTTL